MKPIKQTLLSDHSVTPPIYGNCLQACMASLLDLPLEEVPHFIECDSYPMNFHRWLESKGLTSVSFKQPDIDGRSTFWGHHIICGPSPRFGLHAVIGLNGNPFFDPHPSNDMLKPDSEKEWTYLFVFPKI
jgi:hypothetical protein